MEWLEWIPALEARFLRYVQIDTTSDEASTTTPSTECQWELLRLLQKELMELGAADVRLTDYGCVLGTVPATVSAESLPTLAFLAHIDTSPAFPGHAVRPSVHRRYDGAPIILPNAPDQRITTDNSPYLAQKIGEDIVTADGTTLLGADDKAGVAIGMTLVEILLRHPEIRHGAIRVCFTPDEEIGSGISHLKLEDLAADVAYTLDGGELGEVEYETFSADKAVVTITGVSTHPGAAKGKLVNALTLAGRLITSLPQTTRTPETTDKREGFLHLYKVDGTAAQARLFFILRDFELEGLAAHGALLEQTCRELNSAEPRAGITCQITRQYRNMRYWLEKDMRPVNLALAALAELGIPPITTPIRGGTDGSNLTERGLPAPNLFTGMQNIHGPLEWVSLHDMARSLQLCLKLTELWAAGNQ